MQTLRNASNRSALPNGRPAKKILNVFRPLMTAKRNAEPKLPAGRYAYQAREASLLSM